MEYTQLLEKDSLHRLSVDEPPEIPDIVHDLLSSLAAHQIMLGDTLATKAIER